MNVNNYHLAPPHRCGGYLTEYFRQHVSTRFHADQLQNSLSVFLVLTALFLSAHSAIAQYSGPVYSGGSSSWGPTYPYGPISNPFGGWGGGGPLDCTCSGAITATFTWEGATGTAPDNVIVVQQGYAQWSADNTTEPNPYGKADDGLGDQERDLASVIPNSPFFLYSGTSQGIHYTTQKPASDGTVTLTCSPFASVNLNGASQAEVDYSASVLPVDIQLSGVTNVNGQDEILPGQMCNAKLILPPGFTCTTCTWSISGTYYQQWIGIGAQASSLGNVPSGEMTWKNTQPPTPNAIPIGPTWYWDDTSAGYSVPEVVSCNATLDTPEGTTLDISVQKKVLEEVPVENMSAVHGIPEISIAPYPKPNPVGMWLWLGSISKTDANGYTLTYAVDDMPDFAGSAQCAITQTILQTESNQPSADGLDGSCPYIPSVTANGLNNLMHDTPGFFLDTYNWNSISVSDNFADYLIYLPPNNGNGSQWVPLSMLTWGWNASANEPSGGWDLWPNGQTLTASAYVSGETRTNSYPSWSNVVPAGP